MDNSGSVGLWAPRVLLIGPSGNKGPKILGCLSTLEDSGVLNYVDTYCGVSHGAITALLMVAGYEIREILAEANQLNPFKDGGMFNIRHLLEKKSLVSNEPVRKRLTELIVNKFGSVPTLHGLYMRTGKSFIAASYSDEKREMLGPLTHPNESCVDVAMLSMNIPYKFYQLVYKGKVYMDGALASPYPIDYFDDVDTNILGIYVRSRILNKIDMTNALNTIVQVIKHSNESQIDSLTDYFSRIIDTLLNQSYMNSLRNASDCCKHICLESTNTDSVENKDRIKEKAAMVVEGYNEGQHFIKSLVDGSYSGPTIDVLGKYEYPPYYLAQTDDEREREESDNTLEHQSVP